MLSEQQQRTIAAACVTVVKEGGRGVLVPGHLVLTAAHCIAYAVEGAMVLGDYFIEELQSTHGLIKAAPLAVEPMADIAALGALDAQEFRRDEEAFYTWCEQTPPVPICLDDFPLFEPIPIYIYTHKGTWLEGTAQQCASDAPVLFVEVPEGIEGGTSGSPIVTTKGELVGIVSHAGGDGEFGKHCEGDAPRPHLTLPVWVMRRIQAALAM